MPTAMTNEPLHCALFATCLADQFYPESAMAAACVLEHHGVRVDVPGGQTCCGQPMFNNGLWDEARRLARRAIRLFEPFPYVVLPSGSCTAMVREHYERLLEGDRRWRRRARAMAGKSYEVVEFLRDVVGVTDWPTGSADGLTTHFPCHMRSLGGSPEANRAPLEACGASTLDREDQCCGFGGAFSFQFPELSAALLDGKLDAIEASGAKTVVVNDAGCRMHLAGGARRRGSSVRFVHLVELMADEIGATR